MRPLLAALILCAVAIPVQARDDVRFADSPLKHWFNGFASHKGLCCSFAGSRACGEPNKYGSAVVWPYQDASGGGQHSPTPLPAMDI